MRCRHERNMWVLGSVWGWCYRCGALRRLSTPSSSRWVKPTGPNGKNPHEEMQKPPIRRKP